MEPASNSSINTSSRYSKLKRSFELAVRSLLTACSREDVYKAFEGFTDTERESLYSMFVHVIKSLHSNLEVEFNSICEETKIGTALDTVDQLIEEQNLDVLSKDSTDIGDLKERISSTKMGEINHLTNLLGKVEKRNIEMKSQIEFLRTKHDLPSTMDAIQKLRAWNAEFESMNGG